MHHKRGRKKLQNFPLAQTYGAGDYTYKQETRKKRRNFNHIRCWTIALKENVKKRERKKKKELNLLLKLCERQDWKYQSGYKIIDFCECAFLVFFLLFQDSQLKKIIIICVCHA